MIHRDYVWLLGILHRPPGNPGFYAIIEGGVGSVFRKVCLTLIGRLYTISRAVSNEMKRNLVQYAIRYAIR